MLRIQLSPAQRDELRARTRRPGLAARTRDRLEMIRLADAGWRVPQIARHLGYHEQTTRKYLKAFLTEGFDRLPDRPRPGRPARVTAAHLQALERLLDQTERTWTVPQLVAWLDREHQVRVHPDHLRRLLHRRRFRWKRTKRSLRHKQDDAAREAAAAELATYREQARQGQIDLYFLDQAGFAPTLPTGYTWARVGARQLIRYEAPERRRVNVVGAWAPEAPHGPRLVIETRRREQGRYDAAAHLRFVREGIAALPADPPPGYRPPRPCVIALDNYSVHRAQAVQDAVPALAELGIHFYFLPAYSPELNAIEPLWRQVKYQELPERSHPTAGALQAAVEQALRDRAQALDAELTLRPAPPVIDLARARRARRSQQTHTHLRRSA
jgi:putative transposase